MLQPDERLPDVPRCPPPWELRGSAWIVAVRTSADSPARTAFLPPQLAARVHAPVSLLMYVDYAESGCGPYRELLFIPGTCPFEDGRRHFTISRILVSTWDSVVNGRANWGIPKDRADFVVETTRAGSREESVRVLAEDGREICALQFAPSRWAPRLPVPAGLLPEAMRTLAQCVGGRTFYYAPAARGWLRPGRLLGWRFDAELFPDLREARVIAAHRVDDFRMTFPVARIVERQ